jgi:MFS family permease
MTTNVDASIRFTAQQRMVLLLLLGAQFMMSVDFSILNVALPQVGSGVGLSLSALPWVVTAYALPTAGFTLLFGRIADVLGRRRLFLAGVTLLAISSLLGGLATDPTLLLTARAVQGFSTAIATPAALSLLTTTFKEGPQRAKVLGYNGALLSGGFAVGALVGGSLVGVLSWRWAFLINVPVALVILAVTPLLVKESHARADVKLDLPGAVTVTAGLLAFAFGVTNRDIYAAIGGLLLLGVFWFVELRAKNPLASVRILSRPSVKWGNVSGLVVFAMGSSLIFLMTLYLQEVLHFTPFVTGMVFGVPGLASVVAGFTAGPLITRYGSRTVLTTGLLIQGSFTAPLMLLDAGRASLWLMIPMLFVGFYGHVTAIVAFMVTATSGLPNSEQGLATGLATLTQQVAITIGIPILGAVVTTQANVLGGVRLALAVEVAVILIAVALTWFGLRTRGETTDSAQTTPTADLDDELAA